MLRSKHHKATVSFAAGTAAIAFATGAHFAYWGVFASWTLRDFIGLVAFSGPLIIVFVFCFILSNIE